MVTFGEVNILKLDDENRPFVFSIDLNKDANINCGMPTNEDGHKEINIFCLGDDELQLFRHALQGWIEAIDEYYNNLNNQ